MNLPTKWDLELPLLKLVGDGRIHLVRDLIEVLADQFDLMPDQREDVLDSGEKRFNNRVRWAAFELKYAGLLENAGRGKFRITKDGENVLKSPPSKIDSQFLMEISTYAEKMRGTSDEDLSTDLIDELGQSPREIIEAAHKQYNEALSSEILEHIMDCSDAFFEKITIDLVVAMGYGGTRKDAGKALLGRPGDGGVDGVIKEDPLGLDRIYIQAKRWKKSVPVSAVRDFIGALDIKKARKGIMITTSSFPRQAFEDVKKLEKRVVLIDGNQLANLMIEHGVGVKEEVTLRINRLVEDYFDDNIE